MSETYPKKDLCETLFVGHISLQRRNRLQNYNIFLNHANYMHILLHFSIL